MLLRGISTHSQNTEVEMLRNAQQPCDSDRWVAHPSCLFRASAGRRARALAYVWGDWSRCRGKTKDNAETLSTRRIAERRAALRPFGTDESAP
jgi:hypothetical protein